MSDFIEETGTRIARFFGEPEDETLAEFHGHDTAEGDLRPVARYQYGKDYDRLLYSSAFRKLGGVTQVVTSNEVGDFHNRLTHSLKVAQTGVRASSWLLRNASVPERRYISEHGGLHPSVVRAACLAHDLGHPPFGHIGEKALQDIASNPSEYIQTYPAGAGGLKDSFEGNAQSFRIVTRLAFREVPGDVDEEPALNLTRASLAALSKYPWTKGHDLATRLKKERKWGAYDTEQKLLQWAFEGMCEPRETIRFGRPHLETRTIEGQLMDWSDDIAYAIHDIEDFYRAGLIPLHRITRYKEVYKAFVEFAYEQLKEDNSLPLYTKDGGTTYSEHEVTLDDVDEVLRKYNNGIFAGVPWQEYDGSRKHRRSLHEYSSKLIRLATSNLEITQDGVVQPKNPSTYLALEILKQLTPFYVVQRPPLASAQVGQQRILLQLVAGIWEWAQGSGALRGVDKELRALPRRLVDFMDVAASFQAEVDAPDRGISVIDTDSAPLASGATDPEHVKAHALLRAIIDFVASLTDSQARAYHERLCLGLTSSMLDPWLF